MIAFALMTVASLAEPVDAGEARGRLAMQQYAECIAHKSRDLAAIIADVDPFRMTIKQRQLVHRPECLVEIEDSMKTKSAIYRYAVAEVLVRRKNGKVAPDISAAAPIAHPILPEDAPPPADWVSAGGKVEKWPEARASDRRDSVVAALGDCVVRAKPEASWALLQTKITGEDEKAAIQALAPTIGQCLPVGQQMSLLKAEIRGTIALNYYLLAKAPRVTAKERG